LPAAETTPACPLPTIWELPDDLWKEIEPIIDCFYPPAPTGRPRADLRLVLDAIIYRLRSGCQWSQLPERFGASSTVHGWFQRFSADGLLEEIWAYLVRECEELDGVRWEWQAAPSPAPCGFLRTAYTGNVGCAMLHPVRTPYTSAPLARDRVLEAALAVAEREGFERLSMRLVARELDASTMALYRHVKNKDDLLDGVVERLLGELRLPDESLPWDRRLRMLAAELRVLARRHPELFGLLWRRRAVGAGATRAREAAIRALCDAGLDPEAAARRERLLSTVIMSFAFSEVAGRFAGLDADAEFEEALELLADLAGAR
jgi:AcrR family transcriptional regulator/transposase